MSFVQKIRDNPRQSFIFFLATCYFVGFLLHLLDVFGLRLPFASMNQIWKIWIVYLLVADPITVFLLLKKKSWGIVSFHIVAISQLIAYWGYQNIFGRQDFLVIFHILTLAIYWKIYAKEKRRSFPRPE